MLDLGEVDEQLVMSNDFVLICLQANTEADLQVLEIVVGNDSR